MLTRLIRSLMISVRYCFRASPRRTPAPMFLGVVGDTQKPDGDPLADFRWGLSQVSELPLDALLMPGDLTDTGTHVQWKGVHGGPGGVPHPVVCAAGNPTPSPALGCTQSLQAVHKGSPPRATTGLVSGGYSFWIPRASMDAAWNSSTVGEVQLRWIERQLAQIGPEEPIIVMAHHPSASPRTASRTGRRCWRQLRGRRLRHPHRPLPPQPALRVPRRTHLTTGALSFSTAPAECGIGYRFLSLIGNDLHTVWVERDDPEAGSCQSPGAPRGRLSLAATIALPRVTGGAGALLLTYRGSPGVVTSGTATHYLAATQRGPPARCHWTMCEACPSCPVASAEIRSAQLLVTPTPWGRSRCVRRCARQASGGGPAWRGPLARMVRPQRARCGARPARELAP